MLTCFNETYIHVANGLTPDNVW